MYSCFQLKQTCLCYSVKPKTKIYIFEVGFNVKEWELGTTAVSLYFWFQLHLFFNRVSNFVSYYAGVQCEGDYYDCRSNPCFNEGTCIEYTDGTNGFRCQCGQEWTGPQCEVFKHGCLSNPCVNGATCVENGLGMYSVHFCSVEIWQIQSIYVAVHMKILSYSNGPFPVPNGSQTIWRFARMADDWRFKIVCWMVYSVQLYILVFYPERLAISNLS